jgi:hypothetical protein
MMAVMGTWGMRHALPSNDLIIGAQVLEEGGPELWADFMDELRHLHLNGPPPKVSALGMMQAAYEASLRDTEAPQTRSSSRTQ